MTLTTRLSFFFAATLGVVLAGFSVGVYLLARMHLFRQTDERLAATLRVLASAAETGPAGVEWEPTSRTLSFGPLTPDDQVCWLVTDEGGRVVDQSPGPDCAAFLRAAPEGLEPQPLADVTDRSSGSWRVGRVRVGPAPEVAEPLAASTVVLAPGWHRSLVLTAAVPLAPARASLGALATSLAGLWAVVFGLGLVASRVVCRRALAPVTRMAAAASAMDARDVGARLPVPHGGDELAGLGQSFNGLLGRLEESFERQRRFAGEASHQLRTPLAALLGQAEVALRRERGSNEYRQALDSVRRQALHLRGIVEALLFLARADAEAQAPGQERLDLATWLPGHLRHWDGHPRAADLRLEVEVERATWVNVHAPLLGALVDNLVDNACKYSQPGTPVTVRLGQKDGEARLEVVDAGPGIGPEDRGRLFEPFFRSEAARRAGVPGSGLGLAVACRLARTFHGRIEVDSARDRGTRFELCLPVAS